MASEWDTHTSLTAAGDGAFDAELDPGWVVGGGVNGGYLLGIVGKAIAETVPAKPHPLSVSAYYLSASTPGPAQVSTRVLREGGSVATVAADLGQEGATRITALATYGDLLAMPDDVATTAVEPVLPPIEECVPGSMAPEDVRRIAPLMDRFDMRFDPACVGWAMGAPERQRPHPGVVPDGRRPRGRPGRAADGVRRAAAGDLRPRAPGLGADARADRPRPRGPRARAG